MTLPPPIRRCILVKLPEPVLRARVEAEWQRPTSRPTDASFELIAGTGDYTAVLIRGRSTGGESADSYLTRRISADLDTPAYFVASLLGDARDGAITTFVRGLPSKRKHKGRGLDLVRELGIELPKV